MSDHSCSSCKFSKYRVNRTDDGTEISCSKKHSISEQDLIETTCKDYIHRIIL